MNSEDELSVVDVYDLAADIGKEFETIIDKNGTNAVSELIPKVINILELLETLTIRKENENAIVQELNEKIAQLEADKFEKAEFKKKIDKEMESIEEQWRIETRDLLQVISRLQSENRRLTKSQNIEQVITKHSNIDSTNADHHSNNSFCANCDSSNISKLKIKINEQNDEIKFKDREMEDKISEINNLFLQIERLKNTLSECRRRQKLTQNQMITLFEERADFLAQLQDQHHELITLRKKLGIAEKENEDLTDMAKEDERPRFSTIELKEVLTERHELKLRVNDLEQELLACKQPAPSELDDHTSEDLPVQGPLPYEPDDAPWKKHSESGIRKFFRRLFSDVNTENASFPRRSISALTKMALSSGPHSDIPI
ncbi:RILP-like protein homolog [Uranotaenia lowii]|uniref:RILP-like protein homolog n=1 Tax=Uranotaenia lowii TaxID=190385 RepID=UPI00247A4C6B|nr:RILP-like protein homolog [Uranotaenia lowii]